MSTPSSDSLVKIRHSCGTITQWWHEMKLRQEEWSSLRACRTPEDVAKSGAAKALQAMLPTYDPVALATVAGILCAVDADDSEVGLHPVHLDEVFDCETYSDVLLLFRCRLNWVGNRADVEALVKRLLEWIDSEAAKRKSAH